MAAGTPPRWAVGGSTLALGAFLLVAAAQPHATSTVVVPFDRLSKDSTVVVVTPTRLDLARGNGNWWHAFRLQETLYRGPKANVFLKRDEICASHELPPLALMQGEVALGLSIEPAQFEPTLGRRYLAAAYNCDKGFMLVPSVASAFAEIDTEDRIVPIDRKLSNMTMFPSLTTLRRYLATLAADELPLTAQ